MWIADQLPKIAPSGLTQLADLLLVLLLRGLLGKERGSFGHELNKLRALPVTPVLVDGVGVDAVCASDLHRTFLPFHDFQGDLKLYLRR